MFSKKNVDYLIRERLMMYLPPFPPTPPSSPFPQVSEGLVHVSDPPLHSRGNFLDSVVELDRRLLDYIVGLDTEINELVDGSVCDLVQLCT